jgi:hypothetical protein
LPLIATTKRLDLDLPFLGLDVTDASGHYTTSMDIAAGSMFDAGALPA